MSDPSPHQSDAKIKIVIADDHDIVRSALRTALAHERTQAVLPNEVVAEALDGLQAIELVKAHRPDLLLLDVAMPNASGAETMLEVQRRSPMTRIVIFTGVSSPAVLSSLAGRGAHALFHKSSSFETIIGQLPAVVRGNTCVDDYVRQRLLVDDVFNSLSDREHQVLHLLLGGQSNRQVSDTLGISPKTVDKHRSSIMAKLQVHSYAQLMRLAVEQGLMSGEGEA